LVLLVLLAFSLISLHFFLSLSRSRSRSRARWIREAAMQGFMDAQYILGEMFRNGIFCDHIYMRFARKYIMRASVQGHVDAITRMKELRSCVLCGADDAKLACSLCHRVRYCDSRCSEKHWCKGGGMGGDVSGGAGTRHKDTCPRTNARSGGVTTRKLHGAFGRSSFLIL